MRNKIFQGLDYVKLNKIPFCEACVNGKIVVTNLDMRYSVLYFLIS